MDGNSIRDNWMYGERERERGGRAGFLGDDPLHVLVFWRCAARPNMSLCYTAAALSFQYVHLNLDFEGVGGGEKKSILGLYPPKIKKVFI